MTDRTLRRIDADAVPANAPACPSDSKNILPIISGPPGALSPLAGRRMLVTIAQETRAGETRALADEMAFEDALAFAAHLAALDCEIILAPVGEAFAPEDLRAIARAPGVSAWEDGAIPSPAEDAGACAAALRAAADRTNPDLLILHDPAIAAARRDSRATIAICDASRIVEWRQRHGHEPAPEPVRAAAALERLGLHAADRVLVASRTLAAEIIAMHGLTLPPTIVPPVFRRPEAFAKRSGDTGLVVAGANQAGQRDLMRLDRAAAQVCGQILLFDTGSRDPCRGLCLEHIHKLAPMSSAAAEALLLRTGAFYSPSSGAGFERLAWRAASAGCALILPDIAAHREFWQGAAHFIYPRSEEALAAALRRMLEDEDHRRRTAAACLRRARALSGGPSIASLHKVLAAALGAAPLTAAL